MWKALCGAAFAALCHRNVRFGQTPLHKIISPKVMSRYPYAVQNELINITKDFPSEKELKHYKKAEIIIKFGARFQSLNNRKTFYEQRRAAFNTFLLYQIKFATIQQAPDQYSFLEGLVHLCTEGETIPLNIYFRSMGHHSVIAVRELLNIRGKAEHHHMLSLLWQANPQCLNDLVTLLRPERATPALISSLVTFIATKESAEDAHLSNIVPFVDTYLKVMSKNELSLDSIVHPETREITLNIQALADSSNLLSQFPALYYFSLDENSLAAKTLFKGFKADIEEMFSKGVLPFQQDLSKSKIKYVAYWIDENSNLPQFYRDALLKPLLEVYEPDSNRFHYHDYVEIKLANKKEKLERQTNDSVYSKPMKEVIARSFFKQETVTFMPFMYLVRAQWEKIDSNSSCPIFDLERLLNKEKFPWMQGERINAVCEAASLCTDRSITVLHYSSLIDVTIEEVIANECPQKNDLTSDGLSHNLQSNKTFPSSVIRNCLNSLSSIKAKSKECLALFKQSPSHYSLAPQLKQLLREEMFEKDSKETLAAVAPFGIDLEYLYRYLGSFRWSDFHTEVLFFIVKSNSFYSTVSALPSSAAEELVFSFMKSTASKEGYSLLRLSAALSEVLLKGSKTIDFESITTDENLEAPWLQLWSNTFPNLNAEKLQKDLASAIPQDKLSKMISATYHLVKILHAKHVKHNIKI